MSKNDISVRRRSDRVMARLYKLEEATGKTVNTILGELADVIAELPPTSPAYYHAIARILEAKRPGKTQSEEKLAE